MNLYRKAFVLIAITAGLWQYAAIAAKPPVTPVESPKRIAVLAASFSFMPTGHGWPVVLNEFLHGTGMSTEVIITGSGGVAFSTVLTDAHYGQKTAAEQTVDSDPDVVLIELGLGDAYIYGRSSTEIIADANALLVYLRASLPETTLIYISNPAHDQVNFPAANSVKRKALVPYAGLSGLTYTSNETSVLEQPVPGGVLAAMGNWIAADASLKGMVDGVIETDYWKIARAGGLSADNLHTNRFGAYMMFQQVYKAIVHSNEITQAIPELMDANQMLDVVDFDDFWDSLFLQSGDGWVLRTGEWYDSQTHPKAAYDISANFPDAFQWMYFWSNRQKPDWSLYESYPGSGGLTLDMRRLFPEQPVSVKLWPSTAAEPVWTSAGTTSRSGSFRHSLGTYFTLGTYHLKVKVGNDVFELDDVQI